MTGRQTLTQIVRFGEAFGVMFPLLLKTVLSQA
jgi:hypothetical protein